MRHIDGEAMSLSNHFPMTKQKESHLRSVLKGFTWRIIATSTTITIAYFVTGTIEDALTIGAFGFFGKIFIYYLHERLWQSAPRGSIRKIFKLKK